MYKDDKKSVAKTDVIEIIRHGPVGFNRVPEQERNFDAGFMPTDTPRQFLREERIDGKLYKVYQG